MTGAADSRKLADRANERVRLCLFQIAESPYSHTTAAGWYAEDVPALASLAEQYRTERDEALDREAGTSDALDEARRVVSMLRNTESMELVRARESAEAASRGVTVPADIAGAHPDVDALAGDALGALEKLRSAGRTSDILKVWCDDAVEAVKALAALARDAAEAKREAETAKDELENYAQQVASDHYFARAEAAEAERDRLAWERDKAQSERNYWKRNYTAQYDGSALESVEAERDRLARELAEAHEAVIEVESERHHLARRVEELVEALRGSRPLYRRSELGTPGFPTEQSWCVSDATRRAVLDASTGPEGKTPSTRHGRGCLCTPCQAEDWDAIDAALGTGPEGAAE